MRSPGGEVGAPASPASPLTRVRSSGGMGGGLRRESSRFQLHTALSTEALMEDVQRKVLLAGTVGGGEGGDSLLWVGTEGAVNVAADSLWREGKTGVVNGSMLEETRLERDPTVRYEEVSVGGTLWSSGGHGYRQRSHCLKCVCPCPVGSRVQRAQSLLEVCLSLSCVGLTGV